jgi:urease accessory protein
MNPMKLLPFIVLLIPTTAFAHPGHDEAGLLAGLQHPLTGLDHIAVMIAVGLWAALKGGRALWLWPAAFVAVMLFGGVLGMLQLPLPFVESGILASVVLIGLLVAMAVDLPVWLGAPIVGVFALFHGYAHGAEVPEAASGVSYLIGFALATAALHGFGITTVLVLKSARWQPVVRVAGAVCVVIGMGLAVKIF